MGNHSSNKCITSALKMSIGQFWKWQSVQLNFQLCVCNFLWHVSMASADSFKWCANVFWVVLPKCGNTTETKPRNDSAQWCQVHNDFVFLWKLCFGKCCKAREACCSLCTQTDFNEKWHRTIWKRFDFWGHHTSQPNNQMWEHQFCSDVWFPLAKHNFWHCLNLWQQSQLLLGQPLIVWLLPWIGFKYWMSHYRQCARPLGQHVFDFPFSPRIVWCSGRAHVWESWHIWILMLIIPLDQKVWGVFTVWLEKSLGRWATTKMRRCRFFYCPAEAKCTSVRYKVWWGYQSVRAGAHASDLGDN